MVATLTPENASCALKTAALVALLLIGWVELGRKRTRICGRIRGATLLDLAQLVLCFAGAFVYFAKSYVEWPGNSPVNLAHETTLSSAVTDCIAAIATVIVCLASLRRFFAAQYTSGYLLFILALVFTASTTDFCRSHERLEITNQALTVENDFKASLLVLNLMALLVTAGNMVVCGLRDTIVYNHRSFKFERACEEGSWSPLGLFACAPIHRCLKNIIGKSNTNIRRFVKPCLHSQCSTTVAALYAKAKNGALPGSKARLVYALWCVTWHEVLWIIASGIAYYLTLIARALVLETLIAGTSSTSCMVVLFAMACVAEGSFTCYTNHLSLRFSERVQVLTQGAIFRRVLNYSPTTRATTSPGYIASVMGVDCTLISFNSQMMLSPLPGLLTMPIVVYMLTAHVGIGPGLCCGSILLAALVGFWVFVAAYYRYQRRTMKLRDDRVKRMLDLLSSIRTVKMYAWEKSHLDGLNHLRNKELKDVLKINLISGTVDALYSAMSSLLTLIMYTTLALLDPARLLTASEAFTSVYLLSLIENFSASLLLAMRAMNGTNLALGRVVALCTAEEAPDDCIIGTDSRVQKGEVLLQGCTFSRTNKEDCVPSLESIDLNVRAGSLVAIVGFVGSGKSTLLSAILGDMHRVKGTVRINGTIGYVPQAASVFNATLRDNILFGKPYDPVLYRAVLEACELVKDINTFPARDHTEIGEKGYNLSGGQKQRVSLARAAYHQCSIYVLDDPLSALDPHVGSKVFKKLLGKNGLLKDKTRILVTNQGYLLKHADKLFLMCGRTGVSYSSLAELFKDNRAPATLMLGNTGTLALQNEKTLEGRDISAGESDGKIIKEEKNVSTKSGADVLWTALKMCGWSLWPGVLCFAVSAVTTSWQLVWIKQWTDVNGPDSASNPYDPRWTRGLVGLSAMAVISRLSGSILLAFAMNRLSGVLHNTMLERVLLSPVSFFDATPRGRILNRFTTDLSGVDNRMASLSRNMVQNSLIALSRLAVIGTESVAVIGVGLVVLVLFTFGTVLLVRAVNATRFIQSAHFSRLLQHVTETVDSLTMIRVFGMTQRFYERFCRLADQNLRVSLASVTCSRMARTFAMGCSQFMVLATLVFTVAIGGDVNEYGDTSRSSSIGLALNSSLSIPMTMAMLCITFLGMTQIMVSLERDIEYTELPREEEIEYTPNGDAPKWSTEGKDSVAELHRVDKAWPSEGRIDFQDFSASYRPHALNDSLKHVTFTVNAREKVGIVGRTGAGKSSLVLALLRVLKSTGGRILIDNVDIATVPLSRLRTAITVIPQDPTLVRGTLRANLDPMHRHSDEELWQVLRQAHLSDFVSSQPLKLMLETGDGGGKLSAGQRQLVCLARALLRNSRILVLDEATSQMDGDTDSLIQATLRDSFANFTLLTVAHRLHTVLDYDKILVMSEGSVAEYGTAQQLLKDSNSLFYDMAMKAGIVSGDSTPKNRLLPSETVPHTYSSQQF